MPWSGYHTTNSLVSVANVVRQCRELPHTHPPAGTVQLHGELNEGNGNERLAECANHTRTGRKVTITTVTGHRHSIKKSCLLTPINKGRNVPAEKQRTTAWLTANCKTKTASGHRDDEGLEIILLPSHTRWWFAVHLCQTRARARTLTLLDITLLPALGRTLSMLRSLCIHLAVRRRVRSLPTQNGAQEMVPIYYEMPLLTKKRICHNSKHLPNLAEQSGLPASPVPNRSLRPESEVAGNHHGRHSNWTP